MNTSVQNQALTLTPTPIRPNTRYIKASDILSLFVILDQYFYYLNYFNYFK